MDVVKFWWAPIPKNGSLLQKLASRWQFWGKFSNILRKLHVWWIGNTVSRFQKSSDSIKFMLWGNSKYKIGNTEWYSVRFRVVQFSVSIWQRRFYEKYKIISDWLYNFGRMKPTEVVNLATLCRFQVWTFRALFFWSANLATSHFCKNAQIGGMIPKFRNSAFDILYERYSPLRRRFSNMASIWGTFFSSEWT